MPDLTTGLRPVVRRVSSSGVHKDILNKFEKSSTPTSSYSASSSRRSSTSSTTSLITGSTTKLSRSRPGSIKTTKSTRDAALESKVLKWISGIVREEPDTDYELFIRDGSVLAKVMTSIVFNSVPLEDIDQTWGSNPSNDRIRAVIREIGRYGVVDVFEVEDLLEMRNIPKVTKCLAQLSKLAASDKDNLLNCAV